VASALSSGAEHGDTVNVSTSACDDIMGLTDKKLDDFAAVGAVRNINE